MAEEKTKKQLNEDIAEAKRIGKAVEDAMDNDGGASNLDYCVVYLGEKKYKVYPDTDCQGNARYANVKAIVEYLRQKGWNSRHMFLMD